MEMHSSMRLFSPRPFTTAFRGSTSGGSTRSTAMRNKVDKAYPTGIRKEQTVSAEELHDHGSHFLLDHSPQLGWVLRPKT